MSLYLCLYPKAFLYISISMSRFLRDYIYIPLGGNRKGNFRTISNLMATFILGGIWHGQVGLFL